MQGMGGDNCPFEFNFDPATFKVGDTVSYRVLGSLSGFPFVGTIHAVFDDHIEIVADPAKPEDAMRATRESRPVVAEADIR